MQRSGSPENKTAAIKPGLEQAAVYQRLVLEILNYLFNPELTMEARSAYNRWY